MASILSWWWSSPNSTGYLIASGVGAMIPGYAAFFVWLWRIRCVEPGCWRVGRHKRKDGSEVCGRHERLGAPVPVLDRIAEVRKSGEALDRDRAGVGERCSLCPNFEQDDERRMA